MISSAIVVLDVDGSSLTSAVVSVFAHFQGTDSLAVVSVSGIINSFSTLGVFTLSGSAAAAVYQKMLSGMTFGSSLSAPSTSSRAVSFSVNDAFLN